MKEIRLKIQELMSLSRKPTNGWHEIEAKIQAQDALIEELKTLARLNKTLIGRTLKFPMADSYALYIITAMLTTNVHLEWIDYCDGWQDGRLGKAGNVDLNYASAMTDFENYMDSKNVF
jgi:hypothetical protein